MYLTCHILDHSSHAINYDINFQKIYKICYFLSYAFNYQLDDYIIESGNRFNISNSK
jgi:uncharacterized protein YeeX (DUF496 family)